MAHWYKANVDFLEGFYMRHRLNCPQCMAKALCESTSFHLVPSLVLSFVPEGDSKGIVALTCPVCGWSVAHEHPDIDAALQRLFRKAFVYAEVKCCQAFCGFRVAHGCF